MKTKTCPHLNCLVYHADGMCYCQMERYCDICRQQDDTTSAPMNKNDKEWKTEFDEEFESILNELGMYGVKKELKSFISSLLEKERLAERKRCQEVVRGNKMFATALTPSVSSCTECGFPNDHRPYGHRPCLCSVNRALDYAADDIDNLE